MKEKYEYEQQIHNFKNELSDLTNLKTQNEKSIFDLNQKVIQIYNENQQIFESKKKNESKFK